jgi:hypothetical protein
VGYQKSNTDVLYQEVFYAQYSYKFLTSKRTQLLIISFRFSITFYVTKTAASFTDLDFLNPYCELLRMLCLSRNETMTFPIC